MSPRSAKDDDIEIRLAAEELVAARELMRDAHTTGAKETFRAAVARLELASRLIDDVVERRGGV